MVHFEELIPDMHKSGCHESEPGTVENSATECSEIRIKPPSALLKICQNWKTLDVEQRKEFSSIEDLISQSFYSLVDIFTDDLIQQNETQNLGDNVALISLLKGFSVHSLSEDHAVRMEFDAALCLWSLSLTQLKHNQQGESLAPHELIRISMECRSIISSAAEANEEDNSRVFIEEAFANAVAIHIQLEALSAVIKDIRARLDDSSLLQIRWRRVSSMVEQYFETVQSGIVEPLMKSLEKVKLMTTNNCENMSEPDTDTLDLANENSQDLFSKSFDIIDIVTTRLAVPLELITLIHINQNTNDKLSESHQRVLRPECITLVGLLTNLIDLTDQIYTTYNGQKVDITEKKFHERFRSLLTTFSSTVLGRIPCLMTHEILMHPTRVEYMRKGDEQAEKRMKRGKTDDTEDYSLFHNRMERFRLNTSRLYTEKTPIEWNLRGLAVLAHFLIATSKLPLQVSENYFILDWFVLSPTMKWCLIWPHISTFLLEGMQKKATELMTALDTLVPRQSILGCWNATKSESNLVKRGPFYTKPSNDSVMGLMGPMQLWFNVITAPSTDTASTAKIIQLLNASLRRVQDAASQTVCIGSLIKRSPYPRLVPLLLDMLRIPIMEGEVISEQEKFQQDLLQLLQPYINEMEEYCHDHSGDISDHSQKTQVAALIDSYETYQAVVSLLSSMVRRGWLKTNNPPAESLEKFISVAEKLRKKLSFQVEHIAKNQLSDKPNQKDSSISGFQQISLIKQSFRLNILDDSISVLANLRRNS